MNPVSKKNLEEHEVLIYQPRQHWIIFVKPFSLLLISLFLYLLREGAVLLKLPPVSYDLRVIFLINLGATGLWFIWQICESYGIDYYITNKRLMVKRGFFFSRLTDLPFDKVETILLCQCLGGRLFKFGTVVVSAVGGRAVRFVTVRKPYALRRFIYRVLDKNRKITVLREEKPRLAKVRQVPLLDIDYGVYVTSYPAAKKAEVTE